jgi:hypothetical protein
MQATQLRALHINHRLAEALGAGAGQSAVIQSPSLYRTTSTCRAVYGPQTPTAWALHLLLWLQQMMQLS